MSQKSLSADVELLGLIIDNKKQSPEVFCEKRCSEKFHKIHRKTPVSESLF